MQSTLLGYASSITRQQGDAMENPDPTGGPGSGVPRWVKLGGAVLGLLVVLVLIVALVGGEHGPQRHSARDAPVADADAT